MEEKVNYNAVSLTTSTATNHPYWEDQMLRKPKTRAGEIGPLVLFFKLDNQINNQQGYIELLIDNTF